MTVPRDTNSFLPRLEAFATGGATTAAALALFDSLPPVALANLQGRWRGAGVPTGHEMDGLLERFGWYGKEFNGPDDVHPLLFAGSQGGIFAVNPAFVPMRLVRRHIGWFHTGLSRTFFASLGRLARTRKPAARLRMMEFRGVMTAAMIYDSHPIIDMFRLLDADTVLGLMDMRDMARPFFFVLRRQRNQGEGSAEPATARPAHGPLDPMT